LDGFATPISVIVATADARTRFLAKCGSGLAYSLARRKEIKLGIFDEAQSYDLPQFTAFCSNSELETVIMLGDENQELEVSSPSWNRARRYLDADSDPEENEAQSSSSSSQQESMRNPTRRSIMQWVFHTDVPGKGHTILNLNGSKRYGPKVSKFLAQVIPSCCDRLYSSEVAHDTDLIHVWYAGA